MLARFTRLVFLALMSVAFAAPQQRELPHSVEAALLDHNGAIAVWVLLPARTIDPADATNYFQRLPDDAKFRRALHGAGPSEQDCPVDREWIKRITSTGAEMRRESRFLNAISVNATRAQIESILAIDPKIAVRLVATSRPTRLHNSVRTNAIDEVDSISYGNSRAQNNQINVLPLHAAGYTGRGVLGGILDTGFRWYHDTFDSVTIVAQRDFIFNDNETANETADTSNQWEHGTSCLSTIAGYTSGRMIGPAFKARMILGKTENVRGEAPAEEDDYVSGIEWCDSLGARAVSTSLGYIDWYTWPDMNGDTALCTQAVDIAAQRGMLVITAAGNENGGDWNHIIAPADADSCLAIAAVDTLGEVATFSSRGPSYDGRMKPEVAACGVRTYCASPLTNTSYWRLSGTSLATPLVSGVAFLLWEKHPYWQAMTMRRALMQTASQHATPDTVLGWGIVNAAAADTFTFGGNHPPVIDSARFNFSDYWPYQVTAHDVDGDSLFYDFWYLFPDRSTRYLGLHANHQGMFQEVPFHDTTTATSVIVTVTDRYYAVTDTFPIVYLGSANEEKLPTSFHITTHPNPFNSSTLLQFNLLRASNVSITIFDATGREVHRSDLGVRSPGTQSVSLSSGIFGTAGGVYFVKVSTNIGSEVVKVLLLK